MYHLTMPDETYQALREAFKEAWKLLQGDFGYLFKLRDKDAQGIPLDPAYIRQAKKEILPRIKAAMCEEGQQTMPLPERNAEQWYFVRKELRKKNHTLVLDADTCWLVSSISDFYARLHLGQMGKAFEQIAYKGCPLWDLGWREIFDLDNAWKSSMFGLGPSTSLGVGNREATHKKDILFSLHQVVRFRLSIDRNPSCDPWNIYYSPPMNYYGPVPLSTLTKEK